MPRFVIAFSIAAMAVIAAIAHADGPGAYRPVEKPANMPLPELGAIDAYNDGYAEIQRADDLSDEADPEQVRAAYESALKDFSRATRLDPSMHEAFTYIGYAHRQLGRYDKALKAYAEALRINPDYPPAIEYQGEAYVKLGRMDEAKFSYLRLYALAPPLAAKLLASMHQWIDANRAPATAELESWVTERATLAASAGKDKQGSSW